MVLDQQGDRMNGKLYGMTTYLAGPIDDTDDGGVGWREHITPILIEMGINILDPTKKKSTKINESIDNVVLHRKLKEEGRYQELKDIGGQIRAYDLRCVDLSHFIIAYINTDVTMTGTVEEIVLANRQKKPVLLFCKQGRKGLPNWYFWMLPIKFLFDNMEELILYIKKVNNGIEDDKRWIFFN